jgi:hypothetical protein
LLWNWLDKSGSELTADGQRDPRDTSDLHWRRNTHSKHLKLEIDIKHSDGHGRDYVLKRRS